MQKNRLLEKNPFVPHLKPYQRPTSSRVKLTASLPRLIMKEKYMLLRHPGSRQQAITHMRQISATTAVVSPKMPAKPHKSIITHKVMSPAIYNNILAVSQAKRKFEVKKDITKSVRFGTMTILKTMGFSYEKNKFSFAKKKSLIDDTDKLKLKWKSIRTLVQKYPSKSVSCTHVLVGQIELLKKTLKGYLKENSGTRTALNREQFGELLARSQLGTDENMIDKLFWYPGWCERV